MEEGDDENILLARPKFSFFKPTTDCLSCWIRKLGATEAVEVGEGLATATEGTCGASSLAAIVAKILSSASVPVLTRNDEVCGLESVRLRCDDANHNDDEDGRVMVMMMVLMIKKNDDD